MINNLKATALLIITIAENEKSNFNQTLLLKKFPYVYLFLNLNCYYRINVSFSFSWIQYNSPQFYYFNSSYLVSCGFQLKQYMCTFSPVHRFRFIVCMFSSRLKFKLWENLLAITGDKQRLCYRICNLIQSDTWKYTTAHRPTGTHLYKMKRHLKF